MNFIEFELADVWIVLKLNRIFFNKKPLMFASLIWNEFVEVLKRFIAIFISFHLFMYGEWEMYNDFFECVLNNLTLLSKMLIIFEGHNLRTILLTVCNGLLYLDMWLSNNNTWQLIVWMRILTDWHCTWILKQKNMFALEHKLSVQALHRSQKLFCEMSHKHSKRNWIVTMQVNEGILRMQLDC